MKILLDECIPKSLKFRLGSHDCQTVPEAGFSGKTNGKLLTLAEEAGFQVFITVDRGIAYQQSLSGRKLGIILLRARSNQYIDLLPLIKIACCLSLRPVQAIFRPSGSMADCAGVGQ